MMRTFLFAGILVFSAQTISAQIPKINKPKLPSVTTPKSPVSSSQAPISSAKTTPESVASSNSYGSGKRTNHASGLFSNCSDYYVPAQNRDTAVKYLGKLESLLAQPTISYPNLKLFLQKIEGGLYRVQVDDPECNRTKFEAKYAPLETKADEQLALYNQTEEQASKLESDFWVDTKPAKPNLLTFRTDQSSDYKVGYCRLRNGKTYQDFIALKNEYSATIAKMKGFKHPKVEDHIQKMETGQQNGNAYAIWAANDQYTALVQEFNDQNKAQKPEEVIKRCDNYTAALARVKSDPTLSLDANSTQAIFNATANAEKVKTEAQRYISSGEHKAYMEKLHAAEIAKVFLPKPAASNPSLEASAMAFIKSDGWEKEKSTKNKPITTYKACTVTAQPEVDKNDFGIPKWKYHEIWVSYKAQDGKSYKAQVFASYTYLGGGTYESKPIFTVGYVEEMAAANVMKVQ